MVDIAPRWTRLEHDERRGQILAAAATLFAERHYASVSTKDIADAAGVARGLLHHYFGSKRDLYLEVAREMLRVPELPKLVDASASNARPKKRLRWELMLAPTTTSPTNGMSSAARNCV